MNRIPRITTADSFGRLLAIRVLSLAAISIVITAQPNNDDFRNLVWQWLRSDTEGRQVVEASYGPIGSWDVSKVTRMGSTFDGARDFDEDISAWNTSSVTAMSYLFQRSSNFNADISNWDTSKVTSMSAMFSHSNNFSGDVSQWDTSDVEFMQEMFHAATNANVDTMSNWNTSGVKNLASFFMSTHGINVSFVSQWDTSSVTDMDYMFAGSSNLTGDLSQWNTSAVIRMTRMLQHASNFGVNISQWDTSKVRFFSDVFQEATASPAQEHCWTFQLPVVDDLPLGYVDDNTLSTALNGLREIGCNSEGFYLNCDAIPVEYFPMINMYCSSGSDGEGSICADEGYCATSSSFLPRCDPREDPCCDTGSANIFKRREGCPNSIIRTNSTNRTNVPSPEIQLEAPSILAGCDILRDPCCGIDGNVSNASTPTLISPLFTRCFESTQSPKEEPTAGAALSNATSSSTLTNCDPLFDPCCDVLDDSGKGSTVGNSQICRDNGSSNNSTTIAPSSSALPATEGEAAVPDLTPLESVASPTDSVASHSFEITRCGLLCILCLIVRNAF